MRFFFLGVTIFIKFFLKKKLKKFSKKKKKKKEKKTSKKTDFCFVARARRDDDIIGRSPRLLLPHQHHGFVFASTENQNRRPSSTLQGAKDVRARSRRFGETIVVGERGGGGKVDVATGPVFGRVESDGQRHVRAIGESVRGFRGDGGERRERRLRRGGRRGERGVFEREGNGRTSETKFDLS